jgi:hypothetical protein
MTTWVRVLEHLHGHLACLATLALIHPALLLRRPQRRARLAAALATLLATATGALGFVLYPRYRAELKPGIYATSRALGDAFERKEHLAIAVVVLAWIGAVAHFASAERGAEQAWARVAHAAYASAALLAVLTAGLGIAVAVTRSF